MGAIDEFLLVEIVKQVHLFRRKLFCRHMYKNDEEYPQRIPLFVLVNPTAASSRKPFSMTNKIIKHNFKLIWGVGEFLKLMSNKI